jgi:hypothetical protein
MAHSPKPSILESFTSIGEDVYIRDPPKDENSGSAKPTVTIVVLFWMGATARHAAKYLAEYSALAPRARIIFILTSAAQIMLRKSDEARRARVTPAVEALLSASSGPVYLHLFSNGGAFTLRHIAISYEAQTGKPLPTKALLMDSAPGRTSLSSSHKAFSYGFPKFIIFRILTSLLARLGIVLAILYCKITRRKLPAEEAARVLNDPKLIAWSAKRCYLYSEEDDLVQWQDVERHAVVAKEKGYDVSCEKFERSPHVAHMRTDPQRYWNIVAKYLAMTMTAK